MYCSASSLVAGGNLGAVGLVYDQSQAASPLTIFGDAREFNWQDWTALVPTACDWQAARVGDERAPAEDGDVHG